MRLRMASSPAPELDHIREVYAPAWCKGTSRGYNGRVSSFEERAARRAGWPIRVVPLGREALTDERDTSTVDERLALVWTLTRQQWAFAGLPMPTYSRAEMPGRVLRRGR
jgi:hypothetical protein